MSCPWGVEPRTEVSNTGNNDESVTSTTANDATTGGYKAKKSSLQDIMSEQLALSHLEYDVEKEKEEEPIPQSVFDLDGVDDDMAAAIAASLAECQGNSDISNTNTIASSQQASSSSSVEIDESLMLAMALQEIENQEAASGGVPYTQVTRTGGNIQTTSSFVVGGGVRSSNWEAAQERQRKASEKSNNAQKVLNMHDPLLRSLNKSAFLSEMHGVGDMVGSELLVDNTTANSIRQFSNKIEKQQYQQHAAASTHNKKKV